MRLLLCRGMNFVKLKILWNCNELIVSFQGLAIVRCIYSPRGKVAHKIQRGHHTLRTRFAALLKIQNSVNLVRRKKTYETQFGSVYRTAKNRSTVKTYDHNCLLQTTAPTPVS